MSRSSARFRFRHLALPLTALALSMGAVAHADHHGDHAAQAQPDAALKAAVDGPARTPANKARDQYRHPAESLAFWGLKPGATVVEISPGNRGWWTEILAPYAKATGGKYVAVVNNVEDEAFWKAIEDKSLFGEVEAYTFETLPAGSADLILTARMYHHWNRANATDGMMQSFFKALKPGGYLAVEQHRAPEGTDPSVFNGYVTESSIIAAAERAGFVLDGKSEVNANPKDTKDHPFGVWTLPPTRRNSEFGKEADPNFDRTKYDAIGESDRMTLRFRKP